MITADDIKAARKRLGENQIAFAARFGVHQATISDWETRGPPQRPLMQRVLQQALAELHSEAAE